MVLNLLFCGIGFILLYYGAEWLVKGSSSLAKSLGVTPIVIGLTVVAFGTSAPELVVSLISAIKGKSMIAVGNVVGSNVCNIALVLGAAALFQPIACDPSVAKRDIPIMLGVSLYLLVLSLDSHIGRIEGVALFAGIILYTFWNYHSATGKTRIGAGVASAAPERIEEPVYIESKRKQVIYVLAGIIGVIFGAQIVVESAVKVMTILGVSEKFIGLTIVAFGTSLPELATSVVAAIRKEMDISIGNLVGSNVFNIMSVLGAASIVRPITIPGGFIESGLAVDYGVMMMTSFMPWLMMRKSPVITRGHGLILLMCYLGYLAYLVWKAPVGG